MNLNDEITIPLPPEEIWPHLGNPARWLGFHPKVTAVRPADGPEPSVGAPYEIDFTMGDRRLIHHARVVELQPPRRLRLEASCPEQTDRSGRPVEVTIVYELDPTPDGTRVTERFEIRNHGIPWLFTLLMVWIHRTGRPQGPSALEQLRELLQS